jgi:hypothetical protein
MSDVHLRSAQRRVEIPGGLFDDVRAHPAPEDLAAERLADIVRNAPGEGFADQQHSESNRTWSLTTSEVMRNEIERAMAYDEDALVALEDYNNRKNLLLSAELDYQSITISPLTDTEENNSNWTSVAGADNVRQDTVEYVDNGSSIAFDVDNTSNTTAGVENSGLASKDINEDYFEANGALFVWFYLPTTKNIDGFRARIGSSGADYFEMKPDGKQDGTALSVGWNLIRFDLPTASEAGAVDTDNISYLELVIRKDQALTNEDNFRVNQAVLRVGRPYWVHYYTKYPWYDTNGQYRREASSDLDKLVADEDEFKLYRLKAEQLALEEAQDDNRAARKQEKYNAEIKKYERDNKSNAMVKSTQYHDFRNPGQSTNYYQS